MIQKDKLHTSIELAEVLRDLLLDLEDVGEDRHPDTGEEYNTYKQAKEALEKHFPYWRAGIELGWIENLNKMDEKILHAIVCRTFGVRAPFSNLSDEHLQRLWQWAFAIDPEAAMSGAFSELPD